MRTLIFLAGLCGLVWAAVAEPVPDLGGRWQGRSSTFAALPGDCEGSACNIVLDIVPCDGKWCGIEVGEASACGSTALTMAAGNGENAAPTSFSGRLALAKGTEPYVIEAWYQAPTNDDGEKVPPLLHVTGDTGGEFRFWRRSFPFHATLERVAEAHCSLQKPVS